MSGKEAEELPSEEEMVKDMEDLEEGLPFTDYAKDQKKLTHLVAGLEKEYRKREKVIGRILKYGTGIESAEALRMYPTATLEKWEDALEAFRAEKLKKKK